MKSLKAKKLEYLNDPATHPEYDKTLKKVMDRVNNAKADGTFGKKGNCERYIRKGGCKGHPPREQIRKGRKTNLSLNSPAYCNCGI